MAHKVKLITPHAAILIWNFADRINASGSQNVNKIDQIVINTASLINISTQKSKNSPAGTFEFHLAPTYNWVSRITPGSWCVILMSQSESAPQISSSNLGSASPNLLKMLGRIHSVRANVSVDQESGTRMTSYIVTGQDWGSVFDTSLYIDPIVRNNNFDTLGPIGHSLRLGFDNMITNWSDDKTKNLPTSTQVVQGMIDLWGAPVADIGDAYAKDLATGSTPITLDNNPVFSSEAQFKLPYEVAKYMGLVDSLSLSGPSVNFSTLIKLHSGVLKTLDPKSPLNDAYTNGNELDLGFPAPDSLYNVHTFWQILTDNSNSLINELVTDIRWEGNKPILALYKRVRPFINRSVFDGSTDEVVSRSISKFSNLRRVQIPMEDVIEINAGTNWRDKVNFIEVRPQPLFQEQNFDVLVKVDSQVIDRPAYEREGFKPLIVPANYMPYVKDENGEEQPSPLSAIKWKFLLREWYFNTHLMLNGSMIIIGQNQYIQVGDNIMIDSGILGTANFNAEQEDVKSFLVAHVESVAHSFTVDQNGARNFVTTLHFVRGIFTGENGEILVSTGQDLDAALDRNSTTLPKTSEKSVRVFGSSMISDPDKDKLKGT